MAPDDANAFKGSYHIRPLLIAVANTKGIMRPVWRVFKDFYTVGRRQAARQIIAPQELYPLA